MFLLFFYCFLVLRITDQTQYFPTETYPNINFITCPNDKVCIFIEHCSAILNLMNHNLLPIHRFRQAICGYENTRPKVCCNINDSNVNTFFTQTDDTFYARQSSSLKCDKSFVRGNVNTVGMFPFVARVGYKSNTGKITYSCNGVILNQRTILTTANCAIIKFNNYKLDSVIVGEFDTDTDSNCNVQKINISYVIKHPNYQAETFANNIAMLHLKESIQYTVTAQPICLLPKNNYIDVGINAILVGWGKFANRKVNPCKQQFLKMRIVSIEECMNYYIQGLAVELCTIGDEMPCSGYTGSPLLLKYGDSHFLLGILSYSSNCNVTTSFPSVFVNVQKYVIWILENY
ncbi:chymotrypsin-like protease CTRL-1 isoform X1 [Apis dorsata]|uniref:chymotrypsin-like protease CTRL-1 isoform X1 n=1 Tax=Apis dorsata TaxID=7462 RepID=UPI001293B716|nr:chymotrypsin-like protease CTRL-1 isoform X1 [Apis dorsata]